MTKRNTALAKKLYIGGAAILIVLVLLAIPFVYPILKGYTVYRVETGSMAPTHPVGSIIYVEDVDPEEISVGDVITFRTGTGSSKVTTHRVIGIDEEGRYITKGDNNDDRDLDPVTYERVEGKVVLGISALGYIAPIFLNLYGRIFLGVLVAVAVGLWILGDYIKKKTIKDVQTDEHLQEEEKVRSKKKGPFFKHDYVTIGLGFVGVGLVLFGLSRIISINADYSKSEALYANVEEQFLQQKEPDTSSTEEDSTKEETKNWYELVSVDIEGLKKYNSDVVGWLYFESGEISYPLAYSGDNTTYYRHNIAHDYDTAGMIFIEALNKPDLSDSNTFIYGHNMRNLSMFGKLKYYRLDSDYYEGHQYYQIITEDTIFRYRIFAYEEVKEYSSLFTIYREPNDEFGDFLQAVQAASYHKTDIEVGKEDKVITMVTCNGVSDERFLVHAVLVDSYSRKQ